MNINYNNFATLNHLYLSNNTGWVHSTGNINCITPYIILRFFGTNHTSNNGSTVDSNSDFEIVEGVFINIVELLPDSYGIVSHSYNMHIIYGSTMVTKS